MIFFIPVCSGAVLKTKTAKLLVLLALMSIIEVLRMGLKYNISGEVNLVMNCKRYSLLIHFAWFLVLHTYIKT